MLNTCSLTPDPANQYRAVTPDEIIFNPVPGVFFSRYGMEITPGLTLPYDQWQAAGESLADVQRQSYMIYMWGWGDWLTYGQAVYGEKYTQGMALTGLEYSTLTNYKYVASKTPRYLRGIPGLSQRHYLVVAKIDDPTMKLRFLVDAAVFGWAANTRLKDLVDEALLGDGIDPNTLPSPPPATAGDKMDQMAQDSYLLEQKTVQYVTKIAFLEDVIRQAVGHLENDLPSAALNSLQSVPHRALMQHIEAAIDQYKNGKYADHANTMNTILEILEEYE